MEESIPVVKVTRMRIRGSVDRDETKSPSTPSTPTKKRGKLVAKPQLELIDENAQGNIPRRATRKSMAKELEPTEEKVLTPSRRSTRIRSNTSIVSETTQSLDSPRAKRAARRNSQVGSDTETPLTPARQTRKTRRDSTSSVDKINDTIGASKIDETIYEELDPNNAQEDANKMVVRKSPRLKGKAKATNLKSNNDNNDENQIDKVTISNDSETQEQSKTQSSVVNSQVSSEKDIELNKKESASLLMSKENDDSSPVDVSNDEKENLSVSSSNLLKTMNTDPKKVRNFFNKSTPNLAEFPTFKNKRHRTKSFTPITADIDNEAYFLSDNESAKKKVRNKVINLRNGNSSGDDPKIVEKSPKSRPQDNTSNSAGDSEKCDINVPRQTKCTVNVENNKSDNSPDREESEQHNEMSTTTLLQKEPSEFQMSLVFDSDSNSSTDKKDTNHRRDSEDQCVPVVEKNADNTCEPMDIDETIPQNISLIAENDSSSELNHNKSILLSTRPVVSQDIIEINKSSSNVLQDKHITSYNNLEKSPQKQSIELSAGKAEADIIDEKKTTKGRKSSMSTISENQDMCQVKTNLSIHETESSDTMALDQNKSMRKSSLCVSSNDNVKKSKRKTSGLMKSEDNNDSIYVLSKSYTNEENCNKSKTIISINKPMKDASEVEEFIKNDNRKSSININSDDSDITISKKSSKRKSSNIDLQDTIDNKNNEHSSHNISSVDKNKSGKKSLDIVTVTDESYNKSKGKKSISQIESMTSHEKSCNENKSTLILSQIKDMSHETSSLSKTPKKYKKDLMSKSMDTPSDPKEKDYDKRNISITCLSTSTPLQEKPMKKRGLPVDTPDLNLKNKQKKDISKIMSNKEKSCLEINDKSSENKGSDSDAETSAEECNMIDDECEEASDDYESGDSRDDEERAYEENNQILEKGETLESEEDFSDDSDYEKDSFIVSSDDEDNELLSGSGDDLSMSDKELTMSKKSKKKYNDRKGKEQKKASKEMFDARHGLAKAKDNISKSRNNRQRIDSSVITTDEEETPVQSRKKKRMRIDSSHDASNIDCSLNTSDRKKKNKKRLSESLCDGNALNEKEMTISEPTELGNDPLLVEVKPEPKTPKINLDISTNNITNRQDVEEVHIDENMSMFKQNETSDPLQATVLSESDDNSSISENEEITQNYESMLINLNSVKPKQTKSLNISLNIDKTTKKNVKDPIFDQLNLTQLESKKSKKELKKVDQIMKSSDDVVFNKSKSNKSIASDTESSSNSIDMKLLFPEESNDSEVDSNTLKKTEKDSDTVQDFIPLKKAEGVTNMSLYNGNDNDPMLRNSKKKENKNRKSSEQSLENVIDSKETDNLLFFMDTEGMQEDSGIAVNTSKNSAKKKKQNKRVSDSTVMDNVPVETLYTNEKTEKKVNTSLSTAANDLENGDSSNEAPLEISLVKKKKKKDKLGTVEDVNITSTADDVLINTSSQSAKKKKAKHSDIIDVQENITEKGAAGDHAIEIPKDITKQKSVQKTDFQDSQSNHVEEPHVGYEDIPLIKTTKNKKKKHIMDSSMTDKDNAEGEATIPINEHTKKKKSKKSAKENIPNDEEEKITEQITKSRKRKPPANISIDVATQQEVERSEELDESMKSGHKKKKRKIDHTAEDAMEIRAIHHEEPEEVKEKKLKKDKKSKVDQGILPVLETESLEIHKTKKRKIDSADAARKAKVLKQNSTDKIHVPRLPDTILNQLSDKPKPLEKKKKQVISTTPFAVEVVTKRTTKPSNYLEESVYLNKSPKPKTKKYPFKDVTVLPFIPTATTSYTGFTTAFKVKVLEENTQFVAQTSSNFRNDYLQNKRIKKLGTLDKYKKSIKTKISKF